MGPFPLSSAQSHIPLGEYIFKRIESLGVTSAFGVPGDFNLSLLEHIYSTNVKWYGGCNELNAGYAADGYARASQKFGILITTYGVGSLSAMNACCGAWSEFVPLLHIVGTTSTVQKSRGQLTHHVAPGKLISSKSDHYIYETLVERLACKVESLNSVEDAPEKIDFLIKEIMETKRPGYLFIPCDLVDIPVSALRLGDLDLYRPMEIRPIEYCDQLASLVLSKIYSSAAPCMLVDILTDRFGLTHEVRSLVRKTNIPNLSTFMGKSVLDETEVSYVGDYIGDASEKEVQQFVQTCDLVIHIGAFNNEINSGKHTLYNGVHPESLIIMNHENIIIGSAKFDVSFVHILPKIVSTCNPLKIPQFTVPRIEHHIEYSPSTAAITQSQLLSSLQKFIQPKDIVVIDTCSVMFGLPDLRLPKDVKLVGQHFYLSIGMALPCSFGVAVANREMGAESRVILLEGDGSAQMTIQELSAFIKHGLSPLILLFNNHGYTVERAIKGTDRSYNDIMTGWKWTRILDVFGGVSCAPSVQVHQAEALDQELASYQGGLKLIEIELDKLDIPWRFYFMCG